MTACGTTSKSEYTGAPVRAELGIEPAFPERNGAQRQRRMIEAGATREEVFAASVAETRQTYTQEVTV